MFPYLLSLLLIFSPAAYGQERGSLRLLRSGTYSASYASGRLQVYYGGLWGSICGDTTYSAFSLEAATVACRQLGYQGARSSTLASTDGHGNDGAPAVIDDVNCASYPQALVLLRCSFSTFIDSACTAEDDVGIECFSNRIWSDPYPNMVRLREGEYSNEGIVEVYCSGQWGTICTNGPLSNVLAGTLCRQLGYTSVANSTIIQYSSNIYHGGIAQSCSSSQQCLNQCINSCSPTTCSGNQTPYIYCEYLSSSVSTSQLRTCDTRLYPRGDGAVRLISNNTTALNLTSGRVQAYYNGEWGSICYRSTFSIAAANVICHQLGYTHALSWSYAAVDSFGMDGIKPVFDDIQCSSGALMAIQQCSYSTSISSLCTDSTDVSVNCSSTRLDDNPYSGMIRLTHSSFVNEGRLEVYCNGQWGVVCRPLTVYGYRTMCRQLGYNNYYTNPTLSISGGSVIPVWFSSLPCSSFDKCASECSSCPSVQSYSCSHDSAATVQCYSSSTGFTQTLDACQVTGTGTPATGSVVLYRNGLVSSSYTSGRVVLYYSSSWGNVCRYGSFGPNEADVVCRQLTYTGASTWSFSQIDNFGIDTRSFSIRDVSCTGSEGVLLQCSYSVLSSSACTDNNDVSVTCYQTRIWDSPYVGMVRLVNGDFTNEGRVEVYCNGQWGTVCDNSFGSTDGLTVCEQLGYNRLVNNLYKTDTGNSSQPIWLTNVPCSSSDVCLTQCTPCRSTSVVSCSHSEDVHVRCGISTSSTIVGQNVGSCSLISTITELPQSGTILLTRNNVYSSSYTYGRVVMYGVGSSTSGSRFWGNICRLSSFNQAEADVVCHQLTYSGASSFSYAAIDSFGNDTRPTLLDDVSCSSGDYLMLFQCSVSTSISSSCTDGDDISVTCYTTRIWNDPFNGAIRLSSGQYVNSGLLQVYCNDRWGTVCDDSFDSVEATAACRQLGYSSYYRYDHLTYRGSSGTPIWFDDLSCSSGDNCITDCQHCPSNDDSHNCVHSEDVTLTCYSPTTSGSSNPNYRTCVYTNVGSIVGGIIGGFVGAVIIVVVVVIILRDKHRKGQLKNPFRNVRNPLRNVRNPFRNVGRWNLPRPASAPPTVRSNIELGTTAQQVPPPAAQPHPQEQSQQPLPPSYNTQPPLPYPPTGFENLAYPPPTQFGYFSAQEETKAPPPDSGGIRKEEPPAYDPSWTYNTNY